MKDNQGGEHFIEALLKTYQRGLIVFQNDTLLPKISMVKSKIGQEILPMHFDKLDKLDESKRFEYSKSISLDDMHKTIVNNLIEELGISYGFVDFSLEQISQILNKMKINETVYLSEIERLTVYMNKAYYHFGLADYMYQLCVVNQSAINLGVKLRAKSHAQNAARAKNKEAREWVCDEFINILANKDMLTDKQFGWNGKFSKNKFCEKYVLKVNKEFNIQTTEKTVRQWLKDFIEENPEKLLPYQHLI